MADYDLNGTNKRVRYFDNQLLIDQDFIDEQRYHLDRRTRHDRLFHTAGIAEGLEVESAGTTVTVKHGTAFDEQGRTLLLIDDLPLNDFPDGEWIVTISFQVQSSDSAHSSEIGAQGETRWNETPVIGVRKKGDRAPQGAIHLATVKREGNSVISDGTDRRYFGIRLPSKSGGPTLRAAGYNQPDTAALTGNLSVTGNVGIGTTNPSQKLDVAGNASISGNVNASGTLSVGSTTLVTTTSGNVGIGTASPDTKLQVDGHLKIKDHLTFNSTNGVINWGPSGALTFRTLANPGNINSWRNMMIVSSTGNLGISTDNPAEKLDVNGNAKISGNVNASGTLSVGSTTLVTTTSGKVGIGTNNPTHKLEVDGQFQVKNGTSAQFTINQDCDLHFNGGTDGVFWLKNTSTETNSRTSIVNDTGAENFTVLRSGNVGIGTTTPSQKLDVAGNASISGNVGIGTATPHAKLHVEGAVRLGSADSNGRYVDGLGSRIEFGSAGITDSNTKSVSGQNVTANRPRVCIQEDGGLNLFGTNERPVKVKDANLLIVDGNVGIGTTDPKVPLHVAKKGTGTGSVGQEDGYYVNATGSGQWDNQSADYNRLAAIFQGDITVDHHLFCQKTMSFSDARAKRILGRSSGLSDLQVLSNLRVTDYQWIDAKAQGKYPQKKLIAQEVESVFPQAVSSIGMLTVIPNVYQAAAAFAYDAATKKLSVTTDKVHDFAVGDKIDLYTDKADLKDIAVEAVLSEHEFVVACEQAPSQVFVYGKYVNDYRTVDYDAIAMLNVSATQALLRRVEMLEKELAELKKKLP